MNPPVPLPPQELPPVAPLDSFTLQKPKPRKGRILFGIVVGLVVLVIAAVFVAIRWYDHQQQPLASGTSEVTTIVIEPGMSPVDVGYLLQANGLIRSTLAYRVYLKLHGFEEQLQAGTYDVSASSTLAEIIEQLTSGKASTFSITFYPGATLYDPTDTADAKRTDVYTMLLRAGYDDQEIREALNASYSSPLFADKPSGTGLEGYVFGETYSFAITATAQEVLEHSFEVYYQELVDNDIIGNAAKQGLNLYEAITLASIVQREVSDYEDMRMVAQVFLSRLELGMSLGSDVTFIYAANQDNETPRVEYPSPYNTRIHTGLPPGPIATPGIDALRAVADPAATEYLYFLAGEDGKTYFAYTETEHQQNIVDHCGDLCN